MSESNQTPEAAEAAAKKQLSRRRVVQAGLIAVPVLMTLPVTPAWGLVDNGSTASTRPCTNAETTSCAPVIDGGQRAPLKAGPIANPYEKSLYRNPFE